MQVMKLTSMLRKSAAAPGHSKFTAAGVASMCLLTVAVNMAAAEPPNATRVAKRIDNKSSARSSHKLVPAIKLAQQSQAKIAKIKDYEAVFTKKEIVGSTQIAQRMNIKLREKPFSVYLQFVAPSAGREVLYVEGQNKGNMYVHGTGVESLVGTVSLDPSGRLAMQECRYPITMIGIGQLLDKLVEQWEAEMKYDDIVVKYYPDAKLDDIACRVVETSHPKQRPNVNFQKTRLYINSATGLPVRVEQFGFPENAGAKAPLIEQYTYSDLKTNIGLGDEDFNVKNPQYGF